MVAVEGERSELEEQLQNSIDNLTLELGELKSKHDVVANERDEALEKQREMEEHISKMGLINKEAMNAVTHSVEWGKGSIVCFTINCSHQHIR